MAKDHTCPWWLAGNDEQCGRPVKYKVIIDFDGQRRREYETFCEEHKTKAEAQALERAEDDE